MNRQVRRQENQMANKYTKIWRIPLLNSGIQIKAVKHHFSLLWWGCREMGIWIVTTFWESNLAIFIKNLNICIPFEWVIPLLWLYSKQLIRDAAEDACTRLFFKALLITVKNWNQLKCKIVAEWLNSWYCYRLEQYAAIKNHNFVMWGKVCAMVWMFVSP